MIEEVREYYDKEAEREWERLGKPYSNIEFLTTINMINKYFKKDGKILDIGCGPGRYSIELLKMGYKVSLLDISQNELDIAKKKINHIGLKAENYYCQSALELSSFEDESFDGVLLMGPLYHLHYEEEREKVLREVYRILKHDGIALITYINTWGCLKAAVSEFPEVFNDKLHFDRYLKGNLKFSKDESFTATFFTSPHLAIDEVKQCNFKIVSYGGAESFLSGLNIQMENLYRYAPELYDNFVQAAIECCELPQYRDSTEHINIIVTK
ncbi:MULTISPECIES: class I SAM-dependent methyltransferase [Clostridium]|uniref:class I SAM-dependent methyltransferase n=1 Tax=Clostridium TaxID=1485 RepID=UPI00028941DB|nr:MULTISPECIES: class I SAM-dependent methyltransferase [Clostridium]